MEAGLRIPQDVSSGNGGNLGRWYDHHRAVGEERNSEQHLYNPEHNIHDAPLTVKRGPLESTSPPKKYEP